VQQIARLPVPPCPLSHAAGTPAVIQNFSE